VKRIQAGEIGKTEAERYYEISARIAAANFGTLGDFY
jgi:hypothetical protein